LLIGNFLNPRQYFITLPRVKCELGLFVILSVALTERVQNEQ